MPEARRSRLCLPNGMNIARAAITESFERVVSHNLVWQVLNHLDVLGRNVARNVARNVDQNVAHDVKLVPQTLAILTGGRRTAGVLHEVVAAGALEAVHEVLGLPADLAGILQNFANF